MSKLYTTQEYKEMCEKYSNTGGFQRYISDIETTLRCSEYNTQKTKVTPAYVQKVKAIFDEYQLEKKMIEHMSAKERVAYMKKR